MSGTFEAVYIWDVTRYYLLSLFVTKNEENIHKKHCHICYPCHVLSECNFSMLCYKSDISVGYIVTLYHSSMNMDLWQWRTLFMDFDVAVMTEHRL